MKSLFHASALGALGVLWPAMGFASGQGGPFGGLYEIFGDKDEALGAALAQILSLLNGGNVYPVNVGFCLSFHYFFSVREGVFGGVLDVRRRVLVG